ncbi:pyridoxal kinase PdxY [Corynebacterium pseudodiphtheriticum]|uniref:pyridoxal kinase PdxY n=1 Tax=Corynebacterium pseudodiphtheriticum TaxID=37637 RepID=UPI003D729B0B
MNMNTVLSIQSHVSFGHVGNSAAVFPLQRAGYEVWPVHTVNFSNHTGYGDWGGPLLPAEQVADVINGLERREAFDKINVILSGYQGSPEIAGVITDAVKRIKQQNPDALYACDPVMGNAKSGCFVDDSIPPLLRDKVIPVADIATPNQFELGYLTGKPVETFEQVLEAVRALQKMGPRVVLVTSLVRPENPTGVIEMLAVDGDEAYLVQTPYLDFKRNGSGDVTAALFSAHYAYHGEVSQVLEATAASVYELLETTYKRGSTELDLIFAQECFVQPKQYFDVTAVDNLPAGEK